jgi:hypothetical protein
MRWTLVALVLVAGCGSPSQPAKCIDHVKDGSETDVDCGGGVCAPCADSLQCSVPADCRSNVCSSGRCLAVPAECTDGIKDGNETDSDCGGGVCAACANGKACIMGADCGSGTCLNHICMSPPPQCTDGSKDGGETDVDCGGGTCATCGNGKACLSATDCTSGSCANHVCGPPPVQCTDGKKDGNESDVDCGGDTCVPCANGKMCLLPSDCASGSCANHVCATPIAGCLDGMLDGSETGVDCGGGTCPACANGKACVAASDCQSGTCINHLCASPPAQCLDNSKDGSETDVDCGGGTCPACANGKTCSVQSDCQSGTCMNGRCASPPAQCLDSMKDGSETDVDCGGGTCPACVSGKMCVKGTDCQSGTCSGGRCVSPPAQCLDNVKDGSETDVDCGGGSCPACANGKMCLGGGDCVSTQCSSGICVQQSSSCFVTCLQSSCGCTASCNGHTYATSCTAGSGGSGGTGGGGGGGSGGGSGSGTCGCELDGQTDTGVPYSSTCADLSSLFNAYSSGGCGFPGSQG